MDDFISADEAAGGFGLTVRAITKMINRTPSIFPGARKVNPSKKNSPWMIPTKEYKAELKKRDRAAKAS